MDLKLRDYYDEAGEWVEKRCAHWLCLPIFTLLFLEGMRLNGNATNALMSYATIVLLLLTVGRDRRDRKAVHVKLDEIMVDVPEIDSSKVRLEERPEEEIEQVREREP